MGAKVHREREEILRCELCLGRIFVSERLTAQIEKLM